MKEKLKAQDRRVALLQAAGLLPSRLHLIEARTAAYDNLEALDETLHKLKMTLPDNVFHPFLEAFNEANDNRKTLRADRLETSRWDTILKNERQRLMEEEREIIQRRRKEEAEERMQAYKDQLDAA